jgi:hypothetical protein
MCLLPNVLSPSTYPYCCCHQDLRGFLVYQLSSFINHLRWNILVQEALHKGQTPSGWHPFSFSLEWYIYNIFIIGSFEDEDFTIYLYEFGDLDIVISAQYLCSKRKKRGEEREEVVAYDYFLSLFHTRVKFSSPLRVSSVLSSVLCIKFLPSCEMSPFP